MTEINLGREYYSIYEIIERWCNEQFGDRIKYSKRSGHTYNSRWHREMSFGHQIFRFRDEQDAVLFTLRWVGYND